VAATEALQLGAGVAHPATTPRDSGDPDQQVFPEPSRESVDRAGTTHSLRSMNPTSASPGASVEATRPPSAGLAARPTSSGCNGARVVGDAAREARAESTMAADRGGQ